MDSNFNCRRSRRGSVGIAISAGSSWDLFNMWRTITSGQVWRGETALYRIVQEALTNVGKYASVSEASVDVWESDTSVFTRVADRGKGFKLNLNRQGVGLFSMEERARGIGGQLEVVSIVGEGTTLTLTVPKRL